MLPRNELVSVGSSAWFGKVFMSVAPDHPRWPSTRAGNSNTPRSSARIDSTHTPISRSGNDKTQTIGAAINATSAIGQLNAKSTHQAMKRSSSFHGIRRQQGDE
jgi:hypothetical protein